MKDVGKFLFSAPAFEFVLPSLEELDGLSDFESMKLVWRSMFGEEMPEDECALWHAEHANGMTSTPRRMEVFPGITVIGGFHISGSGDGPMEVRAVRMGPGVARMLGALSAEIAAENSGENHRQFFGSFYSAHASRGRFTA
jgi:hypothetical protein